MSRWSSVLVGLFALLGARAVHARGDPRVEIELAFGISGSTELRTVLMTSPLFTLTAPVTNESAFVAQWGFTVATGEPTSSAFEPSYFAVGNPLLGWSFVPLEGLVLTPAITLPIARAPEDEAARPAAGFAHDGALGLRGGADRWLWQPDRLSIVVPVAFVKWFDPILIETHLKLGFLVPTVGGDDETDFSLQLKARVAAHLGGGVWLATGIGAAYTSDGSDNFQSALSPELRYVVGAGSHIALVLMMNLDTPFGPFTEPGRYWGVHVSGSTAL